MPHRLLRKVRRIGRGIEEDVAVVMHVGAVSYWGGKYLLHSTEIGGTRWGALGSRTPRDQFKPVLLPNTVVIEVDRDTFFDLLNAPYEANKDREDSESEGEIVVTGRLERAFDKPTLKAFRAMFHKRQIVVRGEPRLEIAWNGGRRDFRNKKLFIEIDNADDLVVLPRYTKEGEPIFDGPLAGLREDYQPTPASAVTDSSEAP